jgi:hypothetical protein
MAKIQKQNSEGGSFFQVLKTVCCNRAELELFAMTARRLWLRRNSLIHEGVFLHPNQLIREVQASLEDFQLVNARGDEVFKQNEEARTVD